MRSLPVPSPLALLSVIVVLLALLAPPAADAQGSDTIYRVQGPTRVQTAIEISKAGYQDGQAGGVVLTTADNFPDAQAGATLAAWVASGPLLLTSPASLHPDTAAEMQRVIGSSGLVFLLGGPAALSAEVEEQVEALGYTTERLFGSSRDATAIAVAERTNADPSRIFIADGEDFTTSLVAGPAASRAVGNRPSVVVLTQGTRAGDALDRYLAQHTDAELIALGENASTAVPSARSITAPTPGALSVAVASEFSPSNAFAGGLPEFVLASGENWPDGLSGGAFAGTFGVAMLLTPQNSLDQAVFDFIQLRGFARGAVFGGPAALSNAVLQSTQNAASGGTPPPVDPVGWVLENARPLNGENSGPHFYDTLNIGLGGGSAARMIQTSAGIPPGQWMFTWSWEEPPEVIGPDETVNLAVALTHGDITYSGGLSAQFNVRADIYRGTADGVPSSPNFDTFPRLVATCNATDDGSTDCDIDSTPNRGSLPVTLGTGSEGDVRIFRWIVSNCGLACAVDFEYVYRE